LECRRERERERGAEVEECAEVLDKTRCAVLCRLCTSVASKSNTRRTTVAGTSADLVNGKGSVVRAAHVDIGQGDVVLGGRPVALEVGVRHGDGRADALCWKG